MSDKQSSADPVDDINLADWSKSVSLRNLIDRVSNQTFGEWYSEQQVKQNVLQGQAYFNTPAPPKDPDRHSPSKLLQCHRKASYSRQNAPKEDAPPQGLFWIGSEFEEQIIVPYLQEAVTTEDTYVQNSIWIDTTVEVGDETLRIRGETDPAIVTIDGEPLLVTEVKTTTSLDHLSGPKPHHRAQLHAYLYALDEEYDHTISEGLVVYGCRTTFDIEVFHVEFDAEFWSRITEWMVTQAEYERAGELPPADPERDWECSYCSYKHRCGEGDAPFADVGYDGLLPLFAEYDRENLCEYLDGHSEAGAKLTPTLAYEYPELVDEYGVFDWSCPRGHAHTWDSIDWDGDTDDPPMCPECVDSGNLLTLSGPEPSEQLR